MGWGIWYHIYMVSKTRTDWTDESPPDRQRASRTAPTRAESAGLRTNHSSCPPGQLLVPLGTAAARRPESRGTPPPARPPQNSAAPRPCLRSVPTSISQSNVCRRCEYQDSDHKPRNADKNWLTRPKACNRRLTAESRCRHFFWSTICQCNKQKI